MFVCLLVAVASGETTGEKAVEEDEHGITRKTSDIKKITHVK